MLSIFGVIFFLALVVLSGELFLRGAIGIMEKFKISSFTIGATIVAIGTAAPDVFVSITSVLKGHNDISFGALIGSGIANILICIGIAGIISKLIYYNKEEGLLFGMRYHLLFIIIFIISLNLTKGYIGILFSLLLISSSVFFVFCSLKFKKTKEDGQEHSGIKTNMAILLFASGLCGLYIFSNFLLNNLISTSENFDIPKKVIASIVVGLGNSIPEIITTIIATLKKRSRIIIGNVIGSNIFIIGGALGLSSLLANLISGEKMHVVLPILTLDTPFLALSSIIFFTLFKIKNQIGRISGLIFIFLYLLYILLQINII